MTTAAPMEIPAASAAQASSAAPARSAAPPSLKIDEALRSSTYANFCRVTNTPEELVVDFGLNAQGSGGNEAVTVTERVVMNYFTAKRLLQTLAVSVARHEQVFGPLETDVLKRAAKK